VLQLLLPLDRPLRQPEAPRQRRRLGRLGKAEAALRLAQRQEAEVLHRSISRAIGSLSSPRTGLSVCPLIHLHRECRVAAAVVAVAAAEIEVEEAELRHPCPLLQVRNNAASMAPEAACAFPAGCTSPGLTITP